MLGKLSVIIPVYNSENYLSDCLNSVINQTYNNLEILLINDGSTDKSIEICNSFAESDNRIIIIDKKNGGQSSARNVGLNHSTGDYITFVDSDDTISTDLFYENLLILKKDNSIDVIQYCRHINYGSRSSKLIASNKISIKSKIELFKMWLEFKIISWMVWDKIYKKEIFNNLRFEEGMVYEDNYMIADVLSKINHLFISDKGVYNYHSRLNSTTTSSQSLKKELDTQKVSLHILEKLSEFKNNKKAKVIMLSRIFNVYQSLYYNYKFQISINSLFINEFNKLNYIDFLKSNLPLLQKLKLILAKFTGIRFYLSLKKHRNENL